MKPSPPSAMPTTGCQTQMHFARAGRLTDAMRRVAETEGLAPERVREEVASGRMIIPANRAHTGLDPVGIGIAARCKINANLGTSPVLADEELELEKLSVALKYGADTVMDLSTGGDIDGLRQRMLERCPAPLGTVPLYQAVEEVDDPNDLTQDHLLEVIERQARQGVDFMTLHAGLLREHVPLAADRVTGIVSRGGSLLAQWMEAHKRQNPLYDAFDAVLDICASHDVSLSLGDGLRPGCLADANDAAQFAELEVLGELTERAWAREVQVMIEGPGHVPFDKIQVNVDKEQELCHGAPFYVLGPLVTDIAPGYDHLTSAIGATMAGYAGAALLCYVTPKEHLGLPTVEDVKQGVIAYKIASHAADVARGRSGARDRDDALSRARYRFQWEEQFRLALDPELAREMRRCSFPDNGKNRAEYCSMCGERFCAMRVTRQTHHQEESAGKAG